MFTYILEMILGYLRLLPLFLLPLAVFSQNKIGTGAVRQLFEQHCASCHGADLQGGLGRSLLEEEWQHVGQTRTFQDYVAKGFLEMGMPSFGEVLDAAQIRSLEIYIQEVRQKTQREGAMKSI
jgi:mono/diheme cytochrome c family protein